MRIHTGPGYRVYDMRHRSTVCLALVAGDMSALKRDINRGMRMALTVEQDGLSSRNSRPSMPQTIAPTRKASRSACLLERREAKALRRGDYRRVDVVLG
jgi:hypothetical protein